MSSLTMPVSISQDTHITLRKSIVAYIATIAKGDIHMTTTKRRTEPAPELAPQAQPIVAPHLIRNPGIPLDLDWVREVRINRSAVERRAATLVTRRTVKKEWQAAWLLRAITCIDLTTLSGDDTPGNVLRLCAKARQPVRQELLEALGFTGYPQGDTCPPDRVPLHVGAVCVYHSLVPVAVEALRGSNIPVAAVSTGFPAGQNPFEQKLEEIAASIKAGATEIDIVISRAHVLTGNWQALYDEVRAFRAACGDVHMKTILATYELATLRNVGMASLVCMMAGADFIKTSTGKEPVNATLPVGIVMVRSIRDYFERTGYKVGFKPAGGIRAAKQSLDWLILMKEELGNEWVHNMLFRIGASGLLSDIERQLSYFVTGHYAAAYYNPMV
jgi:deoxyribose-phosphate aldolase